MTWPGTEPKLPSILLNSHMDVVPVYPEHWTHPPFAADMDCEGRIFARGSQDMKCVGTQYLAAIRALKKAGVTLKRTIHLTFVPDEEIGGLSGMASFVKSDDFLALNVGFALDEGMAEPGNTFAVFFAERTIWQINFKITGTAGHGSLLLKKTVGEKLNYIIGKLMDYRVGEERRLEQNSSLHIGDVSSINLTLLRGGVQENVVPPAIEACFDMRLAIDVDLEAFEKKIIQWCQEAGSEIELEWLTKLNAAPATKLNEDNIYWKAFKEASSKLNITVEPHVFVGGTDSQFLREVNIPAIGFSPMNNTPVLLHDHDEFLKAETYLRGIEIYTEIIEGLGNVL